MKKTVALFLCLFFAASFLVSCGSTTTGENSSPSGDMLVAPTREKVSLALLSGSTGLGASKLIIDAKNGKTENDYGIEILSDPTAVIAGIKTGKYDLAALPVNVAAKLYNMPDTDVCVVALNTLGVLYLLENGTDSVKTVSDLSGKTVYSTGEGATPQYIFEYILKENGLTVGRDVEVVYRATADELQADAIKEGALVLVPEPKATVITKAIPTARYALDMTEEWGKVAECTLTQGCIVASGKFIAEKTGALAKFISEYTDSVNFVNKADDAAANAVVEAGIIGKAPLAKAAIPKSNLVCLVGVELRAALEGTLGVIFEIDNASIGGKMPGEDFYERVLKAVGRTE